MSSIYKKKIYVRRDGFWEAITSTPAQANVMCEKLRPYSRLDEIVSLLFNESHEEQNIVLSKMLNRQLRSDRLPPAVASTISILCCRLNLSKKARLTHSCVLASSMAVSRFVSTTIEERETNDQFRSLLKSADLCGIPGWLVAFRHLTTHHKLAVDPRLIRHATEFCYDWLLRNYWLPLLLTNSNYPLLSCASSTQYHSRRLALIIKKILVGDVTSLRTLTLFVQDTHNFRSTLNVFLYLLLSHSELHPLNWPESFYSYIRETFPLVLETTLHLALNDLKFLYLCSKIRDISSWCQFKHQFTTFLSKIISQPLDTHQLRNIFNLFRHTSKNFINLTKELKSCALDVLDFVELPLFVLYRRFFKHQCSTRLPLTALEDLDVNCITVFLRETCRHSQIKNKINRVLKAKLTRNSRPLHKTLCFKIHGLSFYEIPLDMNR